VVKWENHETIFKFSLFAPQVLGILSSFCLCKQAWDHYFIFPKKIPDVTIPIKSTQIQNPSIIRYCITIFLRHVAVIHSTIFKCRIQVRKEKVCYRRGLPCKINLIKYIKYYSQHRNNKKKYWIKLHLNPVLQNEVKEFGVQVTVHSDKFL